MFFPILLGPLMVKRRWGCRQPHTESRWPKASGIPWWGSGGEAPGGLWGCRRGPPAAL